MMIPAIAVLLGLSLVAPGQSLRERARTGKPVNISIDCDCGAAPDFPALVSSAELIVRGTVTRAVSQLTLDENEIVTLYTLEVTHIIRERGQRQQPAVVSPVRFIHKGGSLMIDGTPVSMVLGWMPPIPPGTEGVFFLVRGEEPGLFVIASSPHGAFELHGERITPLSRDKDAYRAQTGSGVGAFVAAVQHLNVQSPR